MLDKCSEKSKVKLDKLSNHIYDKDNTVNAIADKTKEEWKTMMIYEALNYSEIPLNIDTNSSSYSYKNSPF